nr:MAG TPA: hypothetical protein [Bacteriophage sp.]
MRLPVFLPVFCQIWQVAKTVLYTCAKFCQFWGDLPVLKRGWQRIWQPLFVAIATIHVR